MWLNVHWCADDEGDGVDDDVDDDVNNDEDDDVIAGKYFARKNFELWKE